MDSKKVNEEAINNVYKNAHIALQSISNVSPECANLKLKDELLQEYEGYEKLIGEISKYMKSKNFTPVDINPLKKAFMWTSIKMNTLTDDSGSHIAELMIKGTVMGITELTQMINNDKKTLDEDVIAYAQKLLNLEESYEKNLKAYL